jgi:hypothetical protein
MNQDQQSTHDDDVAVTEALDAAFATLTDPRVKMVTVIRDAFAVGLEFVQRTAPSDDAEASDVIACLELGHEATKELLGAMCEQLLRREAV